MPNGSRKFTTALLAVAIWLAPGAFAQGSSERSTELEKLEEEMHQAQVEFVKQMRSLTTNEERARLIATSAPEKLFSEKFYNLAKNHPEDAVSESCCFWLVNHASSPQMREDALALMLKYHLSGETMAKVCYSVGLQRPPNGEKFLRAAIEKSSDPLVRASATFSLAKVLEESSPVEAAKLLNKVVEDCKDASAPPSAKPFIRLAQSELFEMQHLSIGKVAPEIKGEDAQGNPASSEEFKGKILLVDFFGDW